MFIKGNCASTLTKIIRVMYIILQYFIFFSVGRKERVNNEDAVIPNNIPSSFFNLMFNLQNLVNPHGNKEKLHRFSFI